ncbi:MAG: hypothetical protein R3F33_17755 [Planctomycetota bacterium]
MSGGKDLPFGFGLGPQREPEGEFERVLNAWQAPEPPASLRSPFPVPQPAEDSAGAARSLGMLLRGFEAPEPSAELRAAVRAAFLGAPVARVQAGARTKPRSTPPARRPRWGLYSLLAVAALLLVWFAGPWRSASDPGPVWSRVAGDGTLLDGANRSVVVDSTSDALSGARVLTAGAGGLRIAFGDRFQVELTEGSALDVSAVGTTPGQFELAMVGEQGGYVLQTGPGFRKGQDRLSLRTPEGEVTVRGTVFAVDRYADTPDSAGGTCVCCLHGMVEVHDQRGGSWNTGAGRSVFVFSDGSEAAERPVPEPHHRPMVRLDQAPRPSGW